MLERKPDVEVVFEFIGIRKTPARNGYRPDHLIKNDYLTCGVHNYYNIEEMPPNGISRGTITFISPESYPSCLWVGKRINIQEGSKIIGYATIKKILNPILDNTTL
jgi:elongation factor Tu